MHALGVAKKKKKIRFKLGVEWDRSKDNYLPPVGFPEVGFHVWKPGIPRRYQTGGSSITGRGSKS